MTITLSLPEIAELKPKITVLGVGGAGGNAVNNMIAENLEGVEFVVANTDAQSLANSSAERRIQLGIKVTKGLGAGSRPEVGRAAAEEAIDQIVEQLSGSHMVFITAGMGGGTGTGAAPVIARAARELGVLTVGVVTKPFQFEGAKRSKAADRGLEELQQSVDTLIVIPNQNLFRVATEKTTFADAFAMADNVLHSGVRGITDLMVMPGLINLDFSDVKTVIDEMGRAMMGTGEAEGEGRAIEAAETAISNPLLDETSMKGARGVLINITGGDDMTLFEVDEAANRIRGEVDPEANIIIGSTFDGSLNGKMRVTVFATGIDGGGIAARPSAPVEKLAAIEDEIRHDLGGVSNEGEIDAGPDIADDGAAVEQAPPEPMTGPMPGPMTEDALNGPDTSETPEDEPPVDEEPLTRLVDSHRDAPFVAPAPMRADGAVIGPKEADPFAEAAVTNGAAAEAPSRRGPSLLQRISLTKRGRQPEREAAEAAAAAKAKTEAAVPKFGEMDPADRIDQNLDLEDQLEIPAFLRRQAN